MKERAFIIAEYDPLHNGHIYHMEATRTAGAEEIVVIMSPNFVQRGEIAAFDKGLRAKAAVLSGADLVVENPLKFVVSGAKYFAYGGMRTIQRLGLPGVLSFGCSAEEDVLRYLSKTTREEAFCNDCHTLAEKEGVSYPRAVYERLKATAPEIAEAAKDPNNVLAVEYIAAAEKMGLCIPVFTVQRKQVPHDAEEQAGDFASGKWIREQLYATGDLSTVRKYLSEQMAQLIEEAMRSGQGPVDRNAFSAVAMARLETMTAEDLTGINGIRQGLENRIIEKRKEATSLQGLYDEVKTKRFPHSRIRQSIISAVLGIKRAELLRDQPYIRILGFDEKGRGLLREIGKTADVPLITSLSAAPQCPERELDRFAGRLYEFCRPIPVKTNAEYALRPFIR